MTKSELEKIILELCAEDNYGVWELYWQYNNLIEKNDISDELFINTLKEMVDSNKIAAYVESQETNQFYPATLDISRLRTELEKIKAGGVVLGFYWFGLK